MRPIMNASSNDRRTALLSARFQLSPEITPTPLSYGRSSTSTRHFVRLCRRPRCRRHVPLLFRWHRRRPAHIAMQVIPHFATDLLHLADTATAVLAVRSGFTSLA
jgi:hypothetical protein